MNEYKIGKIGDLGKISMCKRILKYETSEIGEIPFYKISTFGGIPDVFISKEIYELYKSKYSYPKLGDVLISAAGTIGKTVIFDGKPSFFQDSNIVWIDNDESKVLNIYLYYFYQTKPWIVTNGSTILRLYNDNIRNLTINYPSLSTQSQISKVLSDLDAKIELNNKINTELEAMAKLIYDYWFVQFDFPNEEGKPYKSSGGKMVWNEELKREIPEGWEVKELNKCIDKVVDYRGKTPKKLGFDWSENQNDIIALSAKHVKGGKLVNLNGANRVDEMLYKLWMKDPLKNGDILMTSEAPCGEFFYLVGKTKYCMSQRLFAIRANNDIVSHSYLYFELSIGNGYSQIQGKMSGSTVFGIRQDELRTVKVLIPKMNVQLAFSKQIEKKYLQIRNKEYENQKLSELRDWLLPMLMNGQVKVG